MFYPVVSQRDTDETILVSLYGFLLKHHPFLANLQGGPIWSGKMDLSSVDIKSLHALRVIEPGDELFLSFDTHPQSVSQDVSGVFDLPTLDNYALADEIVQDEIRTQRRGGQRRRSLAQFAGGSE